jgi:hypothetical protein
MEPNKIPVQYDNGICTYINEELHRYHSIDKDLFNSLKDNYLWFSNPENFNDPYDCNIDFDFENTHEELELFFREVNNSPEFAHRKMNESELQSQVIECVNNPELLRQRYRDQNIEEIKKIGVCCFSESDDKLLMWSHYGAKHKGICLTFDVKEDIQLFSSIPYVVEYPSKYPKINAIRERGFFKLRHHVFATKSSEWSYEEEVRIIRDDRFSSYRGEVKFNKKSLNAIKFGYKSDPNDQLKIREVLKQAGGYDHVKFYLAKLKRLDFGIEYEEIFN